MDTQQRRCLLAKILWFLVNKMICSACGKMSLAVVEAVWIHVDESRSLTPTAVRHRVGVSN